MMVIICTRLRIGVVNTEQNHLSMKPTSEAKLKSEEVVAGAPFGLLFVCLSV